MGEGGKEITEINVAPWVEHLNLIVGGDPMHCKIVMLTDPKVQPLPPRKFRWQNLKSSPSRGNKWVGACGLKR